MVVKMRFELMEKAVERNIVKMFKVFYKNPAIFLCEKDIQSYLYSLLINDTFFQKHSPIFRDDYLKKHSKTSLVHTEIPLEITKRKTGVCDISIWQPHKTVNMSRWETLIGIEIKFNRVYPAGKEKCGILNARARAVVNAS
jgi:hypothetical protein